MAGGLLHVGGNACGGAWDDVGCYVHGCGFFGKTIADFIGYLKFTKSGRVLTLNIRAQQLLYGQTFSVLVVEKVRLRNE